jgi:hypothetical protein
MRDDVCSPLFEVPRGVPTIELCYAAAIMGSFWGSVHLRTEDRDAIRRAIDRMVSEEGMKFYLGPVIKGWVAIYPVPWCWRIGVGLFHYLRN